MLGDESKRQNDALSPKSRTLPPPPGLSVTNPTATFRTGSEEHQSAHFHSAPLSTGLLCAPCMDTVNGDVLNLILEYSLGPRPSPGSVRAVASVSRRFRDAVTRRPDWKSAARLPRFHVRMRMDPQAKGAQYFCGGENMDCFFFSAACFFCLSCCSGYDCIAYRGISNETTCAKQMCGILTAAAMSITFPIVLPFGIGFGLCGSCCICSYCCCGSKWNEASQMVFFFRKMLTVFSGFSGTWFVC